jgi:hydroxymethylbilane synthase
VLVLRSGVDLPKLLATGSPRRRLQAKLIFPEVEFTEIRGNVDTRLRKIGELHVADGTILAAAGLKRLGIETWPGVEFAPLDFGQMVPAVGQGAIAVQCRETDAAKFAAIFDAATMRAVTMERAFQRRSVAAATRPSPRMWWATTCMCFTRTAARGRRS